MKIHFKGLAFYLATALCVVCMVGLGSKWADLRNQENSGKEAKISEATTRPLRPNRKSGSAKPFQQQVAAIRGIASPDERLRASIDFATHLPASEIAAWMESRWFQTGNGYDVTLFHNILIERWGKEDPEGLLLWQAKHNRVETGVTLAAWARVDPERTLVFINERLTADQKLQAMMEIARNNPSFALRCLRDMPDGKSIAEGYDLAAFHYRAILSEMADSSPVELEQSLDSLPEGMRNLAESALIGSRLRSSFETEFPKLLDRQDGWVMLRGNLSSSSEVRLKLFEHLAMLPQRWKRELVHVASNAIDSSIALQWWNSDLEGMGFTSNDARHIRNTAISALARQQPADALRLMKNTEISEDQRADLVANIFRNLEEGADFDGLIQILDSDEDKKIAQSFIPLDKDSSAAAKISSPADWLTQAASVDFDAGSTEHFFTVLNAWDQDRIKELGKGLTNLPEDQRWKAVRLLTHSRNHFRNLNPELTGEAIRHLIADESPVEDKEWDPFSSKLTNPSLHAVNWMLKDPDAARQWVQSLPDGEAKLWAQRNLAINWQYYDPEAVTRWLKTLPTEARTKVEHFMKTGSSENEPGTED
ncbi:MAG: hypothetical protein MUF13_10945 [Akkermansiaceae bacterium]|jgi:hypothetical protein|nr:hypothetical protein [Akkermansiaceae bacterium]